LAKDGCRELQVLDALGTIDTASWKVITPPLLLEALSKGCVPKLRELRIGTTRPHPYSPRIDDTAFLFEFIQMACLNGLEKLHLMGFEMTDAAADELARILRDKGLETLQELHLGHAGITEKGLVFISDALREGTAPALRSLSLDCYEPAGFLPGAFRTFGVALRSGALPELERLVIRLNVESSISFVLEAVGRRGDDDMLGQTSSGLPEADVVSGCGVLAALLCECPSLKILRLGEVEGEEGGGMAAAKEDEDYVLGMDSDGDDTGDEEDDEEDDMQVGEVCSFARGGLTVLKPA
jgi:hypothetical protein